MLDAAGTCRRVVDASVGEWMRCHVTCARQKLSRDTRLLAGGKGGAGGIRRKAVKDMTERV